MIIPLSGGRGTATPVGSWSRLTPEAKAERLLEAAAWVFAQEGLEAPMSEVAEAAGAGVASVYRIFPSKRELLAALVIRRLEQIKTAARQAERSQGDRWSALIGMLRSLVERQSADNFLGEVRTAVADHPDVQAANGRATSAMERVLEAAKAEGRLRSDATAADLRLVFAATRAARRFEPDQWPRMLELLIDALDTHGGQQAAG
jgi:AcrR family transcriptional regulator